MSGAQVLAIDGYKLELVVTSAGAKGFVAAVHAPDEHGRQVLLAKAVGLTETSARDNLIALLRFRHLVPSASAAQHH